MVGPIDIERETTMNALTELLDRVVTAAEARLKKEVEEIPAELRARAEQVIADLTGSSSSSATTSPGTDSPTAATDTATAPPDASATGEPVSGGTDDVDPKDAELAALREAAGQPTTITTERVPPVAAPETP